jgi:hypothetical protein
MAGFFLWDCELIKLSEHFAAGINAIMHQARLGGT